MDVLFRTLVRVLPFAVFGLVAANSVLHVVDYIEQRRAMGKCTETAEAVVVRLEQGFRYAGLPPEYAPCFAVWRFTHPEYGPVDTPTGPYFMFSSKRQPPGVVYHPTYPVWPERPGKHVLRLGPARTRPTMPARGSPLSVAGGTVFGPRAGTVIVSNNGQLPAGITQTPLN